MGGGHKVERDRDKDSIVETDRETTDGSAVTTIACQACKPKDSGEKYV